MAVCWFASPARGLPAAIVIFVPVELRSGGRELGSALSWEEPQAIAAFEEGSPFAGLAIDPDVKIRRQVLAEPSADLPDRIWAKSGPTARRS